MKCLKLSTPPPRCWVLLALVAPALACVQPALRPVPAGATAVSRDKAVRMGLASMEYGQQFVVVCEKQEPSRFPYPGPGCSQIAGMSADIHRDNWSSNYLNYDDPQDPSNAGLLTRQGSEPSPQIRPKISRTAA
jgi:hypothetical protein